MSSSVPPLPKGPRPSCPGVRPDAFANGADRLGRRKAPDLAGVVSSPQVKPPAPAPSRNDSGKTAPLDGRALAARSWDRDV